MIELILQVATGEHPGLALKHEIVSDRSLGSGSLAHHKTSSAYAKYPAKTAGPQWKVIAVLQGVADCLNATAPSAMGTSTAQSVARPVARRSRRSAKPTMFAPRMKVLIPATVM